MSVSVCVECVVVGLIDCDCEMFDVCVELN